MIPVDDDIQPLIDWCEARHDVPVWTAYRALVFGLYQEHTGRMLDYGTLTVEAAINLISDDGRKNKPVWLK